MKALVVGASGGIGRALAAELGARGHEVVPLSRSENGFDITDEDSVARHLSRLGPIETVVVATGALAPEGQGPEKSLRALDAQAMARVLAVNTIGPAMVLKHALPLLPRDRRTVVAVLSARVGSIGDNATGGWYSYRASKAALNQILRSAAIELARSHPKALCVALHPGTVATPFTASFPRPGKLTPEEAAGRLLDVLDALGPAQTGGFFDSAGLPVPW
ncbi:SDR family NAD(P)-dependent oxidoreductase [Plastorhodobacter daqingensis]|uniref:SDR family NAD(P)-dependent oxidoreductase n=1 Tax=Plastorhodobacter daqingensis TaxID=1387281 RepID=A0ABW2UEY9_9RHOB